MSTKKEEFPDPIEYFYLENPTIPADYFPVSLYGIYDRITIEETKIARLKEDIIKILSEAKKFGIWVENNESIERFTDKNYDPEYNISYPDFTPKHFSPNRIEGACPCCSGIGEIMQVDQEKIIDPESNYMRAILPRRDSNYGQNILQRLAQKYNIDISIKWFELPERFRVVVLEGDKETMRIQSGDKIANITYQ
jgi:excinuclease ABC subunit A